MATSAIAIPLPATSEARRPDRVQRKDRSDSPVEIAESAKLMAEPMDELDQSLDTQSDNGDDLQQIDGISGVVAQAMNSVGIHSYADLAGFTPESLADRVKHPFVSPTRIEGGNWIGQAQDRALVKAADSEPTSLEGKAEVEKKPKQASSKKQKEWKEHHCIWVTPEYKVNEHGEPVVDEHGERVWRTRLYDTRSGEDKPLPGLDTASWVKWILERADLPVEAQPIPAETELGAEPTPTHRTERDSPAYFQYLGKRGLTVMGPKTRKVYRFDSPGAVVAVDPKDRRALSAVSALRQVRKPTNVAKEL